MMIFDAEFMQIKKYLFTIPVMTSRDCVRNSCSDKSHIWSETLFQMRYVLPISITHEKFDRS